MVRVSTSDMYVRAARPATIAQLRSPSFGGSAPLAGRRIGFFTSVVEKGGSEVLVADAMEAAAKAGAKIVCWSEQNAAIREITALRGGTFEVTHRDWPLGMTSGSGAMDAAAATPSCLRALAALWRAMVPSPARRWAGFLRTARAFEDELRQVQPDLLFVNVNGSEAVSLAGPACGIPVVNCYHLSLTTPPGGTVSRWVDHRARRATMQAGRLAIHTSMVVRDDWCRAYRYPPSATRVIYNGVDFIEPPDREAARKALDVAHAKFVFCVPARLHPIKGHACLIEAVRRIRLRFAGARILICGDGKYRNYLVHRVEQAGLADVIHFLGWRPDLPAILHACDCVVLPSIASENLSVAVLEALMAGTPAIVSRIGGMAEAVQNGISGLVVPPADPDALGAAMLQMLADPIGARAMGAAARTDARTRFTRGRMMSQYMAVLSKDLNGLANGERL